MLRKFLIAVLFVGAIASAFADTECPAGYGYQQVQINDIYGDSEQYGTPTPEHPVEVISVGDKTVNLFDGISNLVLGKYINYNTGDISTDANNFYCETYFECKPNTNYVFFGSKKSDNSISRFNRLHFYDNEKNYISGITASANTKCSGTTPANAKYIRLSSNVLGSETVTTEVINEFNWYLGESGASTSYVPYGYQIQGPYGLTIYLDAPLRKVGDYADYIDYKRQQVVRNVGVKVLDGTEDWSVQTNNVYSLRKTSLQNLNLPLNSTNLLCNYFYVQSISASAIGQIWVAENYVNFNYDNSNEHLTVFKAWLAQQYAAGTPVTIYYPLATPVMESILNSKYGEYQMPTINGYCTLCPPNTYKAAVGNSECTPCPSRTISPSGAVSVNECGRILHIGDYNAFMPVGRRTEHGLCTMLDGVKYCADLYERE